MATSSDSQTAYLMRLFDAAREDVDSVPFTHEDTWVQVGDTSKESAPWDC